MSARNERNLEWLASVPYGWRHLYLSLLEALPADVSIRWVDEKWGRLAIEGEGLEHHEDVIQAFVARSRVTCVICAADAPKIERPGQSTLCRTHIEEFRSPKGGDAEAPDIPGTELVAVGAAEGEGAGKSEHVPEPYAEPATGQKPNTAQRDPMSPTRRRLAYDGPSMRVVDVASVPARDDERVRSWVRLLDRPLALRGAAAMTDTISGQTLVASQLAMRAPWLSNLAESIERQVRLQLAIGRPWIRLDPVLLVGPAGAGKTHFARLLAKLANTGFGAIDVGGATDAKGVEGTSRAWSNSTPSWPVSVMATAGCANPALVVDEIDKTSSSNRYGQVKDALLAMLEPATARSYPDACLQAAVDISQCSWVLTANDAARLGRPLLSRLNVIEVTGPGPEHAEALVELVAGELAASWGLPAELMPDLPRSVVRTLQCVLEGQRSVRAARRVLVTAYTALMSEPRRTLAT